MCVAGKAREVRLVYICQHWRMENEVPGEKERSERILEGTWTVFFVDEEDMIMDAGMEMLSEIRYTVLPAKRGEEASNDF
jgi:hypothetical protein